IEEEADRSQAVRAERATARDEVDDRVCETEARRELDRAVHVDELELAGQELTRESWKARGHARAAQVVERPHRRLGRHRRLKRARAETEPGELDDVGAAFTHDVETGDAAVDDAVLHVFGDVVGPYEQRLDRRVPARKSERAVARRLGPEAGVVQ